MLATDALSNARPPWIRLVCPAHSPQCLNAVLKMFWPICLTITSRPLSSVFLKHQSVCLVHVMSLMCINCNTAAPTLRRDCADLTMQHSKQCHCHTTTESPEGITHLFYLSVHIQSQAPLVRKYQVDDALQYSCQESVNAKHQRTELLGERRGDLETTQTWERYQADEQRACYMSHNNGSLLIHC